MPEFVIKTNAVEARHFFDSLSRQHVPFAMSRSVNALAFTAKKTEQGRIGKFFDLRTNWLLKSGAMPIIPSKKSQLPNIHAILGVKDDVAAMAIMGGTKKGRGGDMGVPMSNTGSGASTRQTLNPAKLTLGPSKWPSRIVRRTKAKKPRRNGTGMVLLNKNPTPFIIKGRSGRTFVVRRGSKERNSDLEILYELKPNVKIGKLWPLTEGVGRFVAAEYDNEMERQLNHAIKTARRGLFR